MREKYGYLALITSVFWFVMIGLVSRLLDGHIFTGINLFYLLLGVGFLSMVLGYLYGGAAHDDQE